MVELAENMRGSIRLSIESEVGTIAGQLEIKEK